MTSLAKRNANRSNAASSTGPKTAVGKRRSSQNALRHGLRSGLPVLPGERAEDWETHRAGILRSLAPAGTLELELAGRVALCLWRLRRVSAYETAVTAFGIEAVGEEIRGQRERADDSPGPYRDDPARPDPARLAAAEKELVRNREVLGEWEGSLRLLERLPQLPDTAGVDGDDAYGVIVDVLDAAYDLTGKDLPADDDKGFLAGLGVPKDELATAYEWGGWTAGMVRKGLAHIAGLAGVPPEKLLALAREQRRQNQAERRETIRSLEAKIKALRRRIREHEQRQRQRRMLPSRETLETVARYEAHLSRQMLQALHTLERLQAARAGDPVTPPAAVDVTVDAPAALPALAGRAGDG